jgi:hypothetical protein
MGSGVRAAERITPQIAAAVYGSGVRADANYSTDIDGHFVGFGYPGSPATSNKAIEEVAAVFGWQPWQIENRGSLQWMTQLSWVRRTAWPGGSSIPFASAALMFTQLRYNLP